MQLTRCWRTLAAVLLVTAATTATAQTISLRLAFSTAPNGVMFTPVQVELGNFGSTPPLADDAQASWHVVARNAQGAIVHDVPVRYGQLLHVEAFSEKNGMVEVATTVKRQTGVFEVSLPFDATVSAIEVLAQGAGPTLASGGPLARFERASLEASAAAGKHAATLAAPSASASTIFETGPSNARMDYVFIGDGYSAAEMAKWHADADKVIAGFMADPLFAANRGAMNVRRVDVVSAESGVDEPDRGIYRNSALGANFNCYNIARLLCVDEAKVLATVGSVLAPDQRDVIVVVANSSRYGGSGGAVATLSMHSQSVEIALHEIGHTAFGLADEYDVGTCSLAAEPSEGDVTLMYSRAVKWGAKINAATAVPTPAGSYPNGTVGVFQGAQYCAAGKYRPTENSRMRTLGYPWHAVNEGLAESVFARYGAPAGPVTQSGTLSTRSSANAPSAAPGYFLAGNGNVNLQMNGPATADFDLYLYKYIGNAWKVVATSAGRSPSETISYAGTSGYYYAQVKAYAGSGNYSLKYSFPAP